MDYIKVKGACIIKQTHRALSFDWFICVTCAVNIRGSGIILNFPHNRVRFVHDWFIF